MENKEQIENSLELFHPKKAELVEMKAKYTGLTIAGIDDKDGYKAVHDARMVLVKARTTINATRLKYTRQFDEKKKAAMNLENELLEIITPIEKDLKEKEDAIDKQKAEIEEQKKREQEALIQIRVEKLAVYGYTHDIFDLRMMEDDKFEEILALKKAVWEESERVRIAQEEKERKEREDFEKKQKEQQEKEEAQAKKDKEIADREAALTAREKAVEDEKLAKERAEEMERQRKDAADQAIKDTEARMKQEQIEKEQKEAHDRLIKKQAEEFEQKQLEKKKKYIAWRNSLGFTDDGTFREKKTEDGKKIVLWKIVGEFTL